jgi:hypothetical protein
MKINETYSALVRALSIAGLDPDRLEPWPAWKVFKAQLREAVTDGEDAAYVTFGEDRQRDGFSHLILVRQLASWEPKLLSRTPHPDDQGEGEDLNVVRELVVDFAYDELAFDLEGGRELACGDFETLEDFFAAVESRADFQHAMSAECIGSLVYEEEV